MSIIPDATVFVTFAILCVLVLVLSRVFFKPVGRVLDERAAGLDRAKAETERALFRVVQESLGNVHRHSGSTTAAIRIAREGANVILEVADHGSGLQLRGDGTVANAGVGLAGIRERVRQLGGRFEIESSAQGTTVRAIVSGEPGTA